MVRTVVRFMVGLGLIAAGGLTLTSPSASAEDLYNCERDFTYQEEAQAVYDADPSDPHGLDGPIGPNNDTTGTPGKACEMLPSRPGAAAPVPVTPTTVFTPAPTIPGDVLQLTGDAGALPATAAQPVTTSTTVRVLARTGSSTDTMAGVGGLVILAGMVAFSAADLRRRRLDTEA